jgi:hypothetical protein
VSLLLVVEGRWKKIPSPGTLPCLATALVVVFLASAIAIGTSGIGIDFRSDAGARVLVPGGVIVLFATIAFYNRWLVPRSGVVKFLDEWIVIERFETRGYDPTAVDTFAWDEIDAYDDGEADYVRLLVRGRPGARAYVPTKDEETRVRVLRLLEERGVRRHDG